ncbi:RNA polymerase recycling motor ATPase HelR [Microbacterium sp. C7(2022)]|uniref:RNA polymerase recycling motor ATPase HelR n=1 Tax=Microbacterium sp. C7(2022) TaxID=2992759 RepID=UPI00237A33EB|nr:RNA polymerase recycling motor ATPase HelR [Microbacterium sp. C7(2022)]MDE0546272.1 AAA family ATPase [Microbacterium sp. C7(2022)]
MNRTGQDVFDLPERLAAKGDPALIGADRDQFAAIAASLADRRTQMTTRLDQLRRSPGGSGQAAMERDLEIHQLTAQLRMLDRFDIDLCLGRMSPVDGSPPVYIGRTGLTDESGQRLLIDWRAPAAEPFFAATLQNPMGLASRRRYRWTGGRVTDYWDEALTAAGLENDAALDDQSAFIATLDTHRSSRMRDVLATIQADQDAIIRTDSRGALIVDGGPGTGKTVVALHRAAHLLYSEPRLTQGGGGMLFVGPTPAYLAYVEDVLPSLGEESVRMCTLRDLVPEGATARDEPDPRVARLKETLDAAALIEAAVRARVSPPRRAVQVETPWADLIIGRAQWDEAFDAADSGAPVNEARDEVWEEVLEILADQLDDPEIPAHVVQRWLRQDEELTSVFVRAWPLLDPADLVASLWSSPELLQRCAPQLSADDVELLQREDPDAWTLADLPLLDAARQRIGDPETVRSRHRREAVVAAAQDQMSHVIDDLIDSDDSEMQIMSILRGQDAQNVLAGVDAPPVAHPDLLAGPFAHIVVDEAQELTDAQWRMLLSRCPSRSFTIVGDRAQARHGFPGTWQERLERIGFRDIRQSSLTINYRTPEEIMAVAEPVIRATIPEANVPTSVRSNGIPVAYAPATARDAILTEWLDHHADGLACVIGDPVFAGTARVRSLTPEGAKGLEFDLVIVIDPEKFGDGITGAVDRYVAMTRATERLVVLTTSPTDTDRPDGDVSPGSGGLHSEHH